MQYNLPPDPDAEGDPSTWTPHRPIFIVRSHSGVILEHPKVVCDPHYTIPQVEVPDDAAHAISNEKAIPKSIGQAKHDDGYFLADSNGNVLTHPCRCGMEMKFREVWLPPPPSWDTRESREQYLRNAIQGFKVGYLDFIQAMADADPEMFQKMLHERPKLPG